MDRQTTDKPILRSSLQELKNCQILKDNQKFKKHFAENLVIEPKRTRNRKLDSNKKTVEVFKRNCDS